MALATVGRTTMANKIFKSIFFATASILIATLLVITGCLGYYFDKVSKNELKDELNFAAIATEKMGLEYLKNIKTNQYRLTWINKDGEVLYDTSVESELENHLNREEVKEALLSGYGSSSRYSSTLTEKTLYEAKKLNDNTILRISISHLTAISMIFGLIQPLAIIALIALVLSIFLADKMAKNLIKPFNNLDLEHPLENNTYEELTPLLRQINLQHQQIDFQIRELENKNEEFSQITYQMKEGLILLDKNCVILNLNKAAQEIFNVQDYPVGKNFLEIDRDIDINDAIKKALKKTDTNLHMQRNGHIYQVNISRILSSNEITGVVLLAFDITKEAYAEKSRQEFTANVTHELKTPLQSIIGSAELIENGIAKTDDLPHFAQKIHKESTRLVNLIDDIIQLSQIDEGTPLPKETINLKDIVNDVFEALNQAATTKNIVMTVNGQATLTGVSRFLFEMFYNLCDNGIKYNRDHGTLVVNLEESKDNVNITVKDNGIGIPFEFQSRIFERFYRVDKSHSKQSGGTGLGLSIVKHVVLYHHGEIKLESSENIGTTFFITLPKIKVR